MTITSRKVGVVRTNIRREFPQTALEAAESALRLLLDKNLEEVTGALFLKTKNFKPIVLSGRLLDPEEGRRLWELSKLNCDWNAVRDGNHSIAVRRSCSHMIAGLVSSFWYSAWKTHFRRVRRRALVLLSTATFSITAFAAANRAFGVQAAPVGASTSESSPFTYIGEFSNVRHTAEHSYGYTVQLWREGHAVFGLLTDASGPATDVPAGLLEDVSFNPSTGTISFTARLSVAATYLGKGRQEPTHDLFSFKGTLRAGALAGLLTHVDKSQPKSPATTKRLRLPKTFSSPMLDSPSYDEWKSSADAILKVRGPKW